MRQSIRELCNFYLLTVDFASTVAIFENWKQWRSKNQILTLHNDPWSIGFIRHGHRELSNYWFLFTEIDLLNEIIILDYLIFYWEIWWRLFSESVEKEILFSTRFWAALVILRRSQLQSPWLAPGVFFRIFTAEFDIFSETLIWIFLSSFEVSSVFWGIKISSRRVISVFV